MSSREICHEHQIIDLRIDLNQEQDPINYITQFNENTLAFIHRLLAQAGLYYYFKQDQHHCYWVITDNNQHNDCIADVIYAPNQRRDKQHQFSWQQDCVAPQITNYTAQGYNYQHSDNMIQASLSTESNTNIKHRVFPGTLLNNKAAESQVKQHYSRSAIAELTVLTQGNDPRLQVGQRIFCEDDVDSRVLFNY